MIELCSDYVARKSGESLSLKHLELLVTYEMFWLILGYTGFTHTKTLQVPHAPQKCSTVAQLVPYFASTFCLQGFLGRVAVWIMLIIFVQDSASCHLGKYEKRGNIQSAKSSQRH